MNVEDSKRYMREFRELKGKNIGGIGLKNLL